MTVNIEKLIAETEKSGQELKEKGKKMQSYCQTLKDDEDPFAVFCDVQGELNDEDRIDNAKIEFEREKMLESVGEYREKLTKIYKELEECEAQLASLIKKKGTASFSELHALEEEIEYTKNRLEIIKGKKEKCYDAMWLRCKLSSFNKN